MLEKKLVFFFLLMSLVVTDESEIILIPHSHDDLGWLDTIEGYYESKVSKIFDSTLKSLEKDMANNKRKFVYSEVGFLKMFINRDPALKEDKIRRIQNLIDKGKFEFINGGMSQSDSAAPFYEDIMENWFYGLSYLKRNFNSNSKGGWQIDPFGHSKCLSYLARLFGMKEIVVNRIGSANLNKFSQEKNLTFEWNFHDGSSIRTHLCTNHYSTPPGIHCDGDCNISKFDKNRFDQFLNEKNKSYTFNPWYFFGDDFNFVNAENNFSFIEKVLENYPKINYGVFSDYIKLVDEQQKKNPKALLQFEDDFFVYEEGNGDSWSGYFTSKQRLKKRIRALGKMLRAFKMLVIRKSLKNGIIEKIDEYFDIAERFGVFLHHDCITGTAKRRVDEDYLSLMSDLENKMTEEINQLFDTQFYFCKDDEFLFNLQTCSEKQEFGHSFIFNVYNPSPSLMKRNIKLVLAKNNYTIEKIGGSIIEYGTTLCIENKCEYFFQDSLNGFSLTQYKISIKENHKIGIDVSENNNEDDDELFNFEDYLINDRNLVLKSKTDRVVNEISVLTIDSQSSGAYILKYDNKLNIKKLKFEGSRSISRSGSIQTLTYTNKGWSLLIINDMLKPSIYEVRILVTDIDIFKTGIDLVLSIRNPLINNTHFMTDSNGLFEMKREKVPKFETSVFPTTSDATIQDKTSGFMMKVLSTNSQAAISTPGVLMIYLERSTTKDDSKGVDENLQLLHPFLTSNYVINAASEEDMNSSFTEAKYMMDVDYITFYSKNEFTGDFDNSDVTLNTGQDLRFVADFINKKSFFLRVQSVRRDSSISFDTYILKMIFGNYNYIPTSYENYFYGDNQRNNYAQENIIINPLEFKLFRVDLL